MGPATFSMTCSDVIAVRFAPVPSRSPIRCFMARCASGDLLSSFATGVGHPARFACRGNWSIRSVPSSRGQMSAPESFQSLVVVVVQPANTADPGSRSVPCPGPPFGPSCWHGVGHPLSNKVESLPDVRRADAVCAQNGKPEGVTRCFHVSSYNVDPGSRVIRRCESLTVSLSDNLATGNLLSEDGGRVKVDDEPSQFGPEVAMVVGAESLAGSREGLTGTAPRENRSGVIPPGESHGVGPDADAGEEMPLGKSAKLSC